MEYNIKALIEILFDPEARDDEKDDAIMYLGESNDNTALESLIRFALNNQSKKFLMDTCGESIAKIWVARNNFDPKVFNQLPHITKYEAEAYIKASRPEWLTDE